MTRETVTEKMMFRFGHYTADAARRELLRDGGEVEVQPRVFDLLVYLLAHPECADYRRQVPMIIPFIGSRKGRPAAAATAVRAS